jgi:hypothetical protein
MIVKETLTIGGLMDFLRIARPEDLHEVFCTAGQSIYKEPLSQLEGASAYYWQGADGQQELLGIGCVSSKAGFVCIPWFLLTVNVYKHKIEFLRFSKRYLKRLLESNSYLANTVRGNNSLHITWLTWLGCQWVKETANSKTFIFKGEGRDV